MAAVGRRYVASVTIRDAMRALSCVFLLTFGSGCAAAALPAEHEDVALGVSLLSAAERRARAGEIRDAARDSGITQGYLLAGIADAETLMCHCQDEYAAAAGWAACPGPSSADCGGGPVLAGGGDGPCGDLQGGIGMFQFDAGTFDQTLAREGDRILTVAGNTAAAVDFVANMVINSQYVADVSTREQAIAWTNGVRIDNDRWDAWVSTVTHYYNGCSNLGSAFCQERYGRYRDHTVDMFNEMGAPFWEVEGGSDYFAASYVDQSFPLASEAFELYPGQDAAGYIELRNDGTASWTPDVTFLAPTEPRDTASVLAGPDWISPTRAATVTDVIAPGEIGRFEFTLLAPETLGDYSQFFGMVDDDRWFSDMGGPPDDQLQVSITVIEPPPCPSGTSATWVCDGDERSHCRWGEIVREACADGCVTQSDGATCASMTPDPTNGEVGAAGAGIGGVGGLDTSTAGVGGTDMGAAGEMLDSGSDGSEDNGGCAVAPGPSGLPGMWLPVGLALLALRRRSRRA